MDEFETIVNDWPKIKKQLERVRQLVSCSTLDHPLTAYQLGRFIGVSRDHCGQFLENLADLKLVEKRGCQLCMTCGSITENNSGKILCTSCAKYLMPEEMHPAACYAASQNINKKMNKNEINGIPSIELGLKHQEVAENEKAREFFTVIKEIIEDLKTTVRDGHVTFPMGIAACGEPTKTRLSQSSVMDVSEVGHYNDQPFSFDHSMTKQWRFSTAFILQIAEGRTKDWMGDSEIRDFVRILVLHELVHPDQQITGRNFQDIGRAGVCLEAADYDADVFSILALLSWKKDDNHKQARAAGDGSIVSGIIRTLLKGLFLFDSSEQGLNLKQIPVRRLRRYLIWFLQYVRVTMVNSHTFNTSNLNNRPQLEITFLPEVLDAEKVQTYVEISNIATTQKMDLTGYINSKFFRWNGSSTHGNPAELIQLIAQGIQKHDEIIERFAHILEVSWKGAQIE